MAVILITHDLGVVAETCDEVAVMYAGRIAERGPVHEIFAKPLHPYTQGLIRCLPKLDHPPKTDLPVIPGMVPQPPRHALRLPLCLPLPEQAQTTDVLTTTSAPGRTAATVMASKPARVLPHNCPRHEPPHRPEPQDALSGAWRRVLHDEGDVQGGGWREL
jgi:ABC-type glutathione transport system ATPase component